MRGWRRNTVIACAAGCGLAAAVLTAAAVFMELAVADQLASVVGAVAGLGGLGASVWALMGSGGAAVEARNGGVAAGGHIGRVITGNNNQATPLVVPYDRSQPSSSGSAVRAWGAGSTAAAEGIHEVITGEGNRT
jgi:hypothetical protein